MNNKIKKYELLSAYLDGELSPEEVEQLENEIKSSLDLQKKLQDLKETKQLVSSAYKKIPESPYFETKLFAELKSRKAWYKSFIKWSPAIALGTATIVLMVFLKFNPGIIENLIEQQKSNIAGFYKENLQPLLFAADLNNEDIFNFAMYKQLPLDKENNQMLHLGYDENGKEYFEIKKEDENRDENNFEKFIVSLDLNKMQKEQIDSIMKQYAEELQAQILVNKNNTVAINSNLWNYQRAIQSDLLTFAAESNRNEFDKFIPGTVSLTSNPNIVKAVNDLRSVKNKNYIILTPDSIFSEELEFDPEQFKMDFKQMQKDLEEESANLKEQSKQLKEMTYKIRYDSSWKKLQDHFNLQKDFSITIDSNICRVVIPKFVIPDVHIPDVDSLFNSFDSIAKNFKFYSYSIPRIEYFNDKMKFHFDGDSSRTFEFRYFNMDSLMGAQREIMDSLKNFNWNNMHYLNDSLVFNNFPGFENFFHNYNGDTDIELQMKELKKELEKFRNEMQDWRKEMKEKFNSQNERDKID